MPLTQAPDEALLPIDASDTPDREANAAPADSPGATADGETIEAFGMPFVTELMAGESSLVLLPPVERLDPSLLVARVQAFALASSPAVTAPPEGQAEPWEQLPPPAGVNCNYDGLRPPANPPRVLRPDGSVLVPDYVEYQDSLSRVWVWDGKTWTEKPANATAVNPCP